MEKTILGITGEMAAGKGTATEYLMKKYGATSYRFSTALRDIAKRMYLKESRENLQKLSTVLRENFDDNILSMVIYKDVESDENDLIVIDGVRRVPDIEFLKTLPGFRLAYIDADIEKRYERIIKRGENSDDNSKTFEEFKKDHQREAELQIKDLKNRADVIVDNNGSFEDLYKQLDEIIK
ncbi:MAG: AAA family ATPase [Parcubacteria group bacterium]